MQRTKLTAQDKQQIVELYRLPDSTIAALGAQFEVSASTVQRLLKELLDDAEYQVLAASKRSHRRKDESHTLGSDPGSGLTPASTTVQLTINPVELLEGGALPEPPILALPIQSVDPLDSDLASTLPLELNLAPPEPGLVTNLVSEEPALLSGTGMDEGEIEEDGTDEDESFDVLSENGLQENDLQENGEEFDNELEDEELEDELLEDEESDSADVAAIRAELEIERAKGLLDDLDIEDDEDEDEEDEEQESDGVTADALAQAVDTLASSQSLSVLTLEELDPPDTCFVVIDRHQELTTRPLKDFDHAGILTPELWQARTLPVFDSHKLARRFSEIIKRGHNYGYRVINFSGEWIPMVRSYLCEKGITHLLFDGQVYDLATPEPAEVPS